MKTNRTYRRLLVIALLSLAAREGLGQQTYYFVNKNAPVFDAQGNRLAGANYAAMLYWGATPDVLTPAFAAASSTMLMTPALFTLQINGMDGYFFQHYVNAQICPPAVPWLQVRAWDLRLGATYENVLSQNIGGYGVSPIFQTPGGDGCSFLTPEIPRSLVGLQSFSLSPVVPEPSAALLLLLGVPWLIWRCRTR